MKITNNSSLEVDEALFNRVSELLGLDGQLKDKEIFDQEELEIVVDNQKQRDGEENSLYGQYTTGNIIIYPCRNCKEGAVLITFLHEIIHHWLYEKHEDIYDEEWTETLCEEIAQAVFKEMGGKILPQNNCERYVANLPLSNIHKKSKAGTILFNLNKFKTSELEECTLKRKWST